MSREPDTFLWLKRPTIANIKAVLEWAHKRALRANICYSDILGNDTKTHPSDKKFDDIAPHIGGRKAKLFFRIIVRKGLNEFMQVDDKKCTDLLDIGVHCVRIGEKEYFINFYLSTDSLGALKRKFPVSEKIVH